MHAMQFTHQARFETAEGVHARDESATRPRLRALATALVTEVFGTAQSTHRWPHEFTFAWAVSVDDEAPQAAKMRCTFPGSVDETYPLDRYSAALVAAALPCLQRCDPDAIVLWISLRATYGAEQAMEEAGPVEQQVAESLPGDLASEQAPLQASALLRALAEDARLGYAVMNVVQRRRQRLQSER